MGGRVGGCGRWWWRRRRRERRPDDFGFLATTSRARHPRRRGHRLRYCGRGAGRAGGSANDRRDIEVSGRNDNGHRVHASQVRCTRLRRRLGSGAMGRRVGGCGRWWWRRRWGGWWRDDFGFLATTSRARHPRRRGRRARHCGRGSGGAGGTANDRRDIEVSGRNDYGHSVHASQVRCTRLRRRLGSGATGGRVGGCRRRGWRRRWGGWWRDDCGILATTSRARHPRRRGRRARHSGRGSGRAGGTANDRRDIEVSGRNDYGHSVHASQVRCTRLRRRLGSGAMGRRVGGCRWRRGR
jgi:hypothetical protein